MDWKSADTDHGLGKLGYELSLQGFIYTFFLLVTFFWMWWWTIFLGHFCTLLGESIYSSYVSANRRSFHHTRRRTWEAVLLFSFGSKLDMLMLTFQMRKRAKFSCNCHEAYIMSRTKSRKIKLLRVPLFVLFCFVMVGLLLEAHSQIHDWHIMIFDYSS